MTGVRGYCPLYARLGIARPRIDARASRALRGIDEQPRIDAIRAMTRLETDAGRSIAKTDASLGVRQRFLSPARQSAGVA